ncbi:MAG: tyrosine-protein phosphatase [Desulfobacterales bacterium]|nr:tyrosine-protein phosphatase [Desulfobacterales bacterium]
MAFQITKRTSKIIATVFALAIIVAAGSGYHHKTKPRHFLTVTPGVFYRSAYLRPDNLEKVLERYKIKTVVNLIGQDNPEKKTRLQNERRICREKGVKLVEMPMPVETPPTPDQLSAWLALLDSVEDHPILVHCMHGVVRTGMMAAVYEIEYLNKNNEEVLSGLPMFGHDLYMPKRKPMRDFILGYRKKTE